MKILKESSIFISVAFVFVGVGGEQSDSSSESPYGENVFCGVRPGRVNSSIESLTTAYLSCMFIV